ncbi:hypothetical protein CVT26_003052 [Gymnopilus dilepis]|uniref:F-box domain-containing protein n=1 Tax=Gymnopilus dilepis TaxID=231916 RepID=A0A409Y4Q2_9AGAR|nr:hypothetical protein CVT26_003052 [Gymnopilus dilepis]
MSKEPNSVYIRDVALASRSTIEPEGDESGIQRSSVNLAQVIPQEIIDLIIDEVASDMGDSVRRETLYACSLSCQSFRTRVVYHTYSKIKIVETLTIDHSGIRLRKLLEILKNNPLIGAYVRVLEVGGYITSAFVSSCLLDITLIPSILSCLRGVQRLILTETGERPMSWTSLRSDVIDSLLVIIQGSSLHSLEIEGFWDFPLDCVLRCKELEELTVIRAGNPTAPQSLPSDHSSPPLKRLKVDDSRTFLLPLLLIPRLLSRLQILQIRLKSLEDFISAGDLLIRTAQTLNELHLFFHMMPISVSGM